MKTDSLLSNMLLTALLTALAMPCAWADTPAGGTMPVEGKTYYICCDNDAQQWLYNNGGTLSVADACREADNAYLWTCRSDGDNLSFINGAGGYLGYKAMSATPYAYAVSATGAVRDGCVTLFAVAANRYVVMKANGGFDQSTKAGYDKETTNFSSDFVFIEYVSSETVRTVTVTCNYPIANGLFTIGGRSATGNCSLKFEPSDTKSGAILACERCEPAYTFEGFYADGKPLGKTVTLSSATADCAVEARFNPAFLSQTFGEKWVRLTFARLTTCCASVVSGSEGETPINQLISSTDEGQLWCLVGTPDDFILYNKVAGETLALSADATSNGSPTLLVPVGDAVHWHLINFTSDATYAGFAIAPTGTEATGFNSYGGDGAGWPLKFWTASAPGSHWLPVSIDGCGLNVNLRLLSETAHPEINTRVAIMDLTVNGNKETRQLQLDDLNTSTQYFLPTGSTASIVHRECYRGYRFESIDGAPDPTSLPTCGSINVTYTAAEDSALSLFYSNDSYGVPYRIPAIAATHTGRLIAVSDRRYCRNDIGYGHIDIVARTSDDNGRTWSEDAVVCQGSGIPGSDDCGYGDAAIVADRESDRVLLLCVTGNVVFTSSTRERPNRHARTYSADGGLTWQTSTDITNQLYTLLPQAKGLFVGSGRICQSRIVKKGSYYRLYCAVLASCANASGKYSPCNFVIYSDDFGETWSVLGGTAQNYSTDSPCQGGDEPKVEELPNGDILLSSRKKYGRYFNVFTFANINNSQENGRWGTMVDSNNISTGIKVGGNSCNGEILSLPVAVAQTPSRQTTLLIQSLPAGSERRDVGLWFKAISSTRYTPSNIATSWTKGLQVSNTISAYSTMCVQADGRIGFLFEEGPGDNYGYNIIYVPLSVEQITAGRYLTITEKEDAVAAPSAAQTEPELYDLGGRRVKAAAQRGIYIKDGKKLTNK